MIYIYILYIYVYRYIYKGDIQIYAIISRYHAVTINTFRSRAWPIGRARPVHCMVHSQALKNGKKPGKIMGKLDRFMGKSMKIPFFHGKIHENPLGESSNDKYPLVIKHSHGIDDPFSSMVYL